MRAKTVGFERGMHPKKAMGIGLGSPWIYNIKNHPDPDRGYTFDMDVEEITKWIKSVIASISDNEIDRYFAFTLRDILNEIPDRYFEEKKEQEITEELKRRIQNTSSSWMGMHSDRAMRGFARNSGLNI